MLSWIGIDLDAKAGVDKEDMSSAASSNTDYIKQANAVKDSLARLLATFKESEIILWGSDGREAPGSQAFP